MTFDHHAMVQPAVPLRPNSGLPEFGTLIDRSRIYPTSAGERWTCWLDLSETCSGSKPSRPWHDGKRDNSPARRRWGTRAPAGPRFAHHLVHFKAGEPFDLARQIDGRLDATLAIVCLVR